MKTLRSTALLATCLLSAAAWAQSGSAPLNLKIPANVPPASGSSAAPASASSVPVAAAPATAPSTQANAGQTAYAKDPPGTYYGDTSGRLGDSQAALSQPAAVVCDDATYNQPQMHGEVGVGVMSGKHTSGSYTGGGVTLSQAFGSCEHPTGGVSISVGGSQGHYGH